MHSSRILGFCLGLCSQVSQRSPAQQGSALLGRLAICSSYCKYEFIDLYLLWKAMLQILSCCNNAKVFRSACWDHIPYRAQCRSCCQVVHITCQSTSIVRPADDEGQQPALNAPHDRLHSRSQTTYNFDNVVLALSKTRAMQDFQHQRPSNHTYGWQNRCTAESCPLFIGNGGRERTALNQQDKLRS